jgi:hypothetical protein
MRVLSLQSGETPSGQQRVAVLVNVKILSTVSFLLLGLVRVTGTATRMVIVKKPSPADTRDTSVQEMLAPVVREQLITSPTAKGPVVKSVEVEIEVSLDTSCNWKQLSYTLSTTMHSILVGGGQPSGGQVPGDIWETFALVMVKSSFFLLYQVSFFLFILLVRTFICSWWTIWF